MTGAATFSGDSLAGAATFSGDSPFPEPALEPELDRRRCLREERFRCPREREREREDSSDEDRLRDRERDLRRGWRSWRERPRERERERRNLRGGGGGEALGGNVRTNCDLVIPRRDPRMHLRSRERDRRRCGDRLRLSARRPVAGEAPEKEGERQKQ